MQRPKPGEQFKKNESLFSDTLFGEMYPTLWEYLSATQWEDKSPRVTTTLLIFIDSGVLKCCVNDRDLNRSAFVTAPTYSLMMDAIEEGLRDNTLDWRGRKGGGTSSGYTPY